MTPAFEAIANFRDFGGYEAGDRRLRRGLLYRSAHLAHATDGDLQRLADLGVSVIVDLRREPERAREPGRRPPGFAGAVIENDVEEEGGTSDAGLMLHLSVEDFRERSRGFYRRALFEPRHIDLFRRYFLAIAEDRGAVLVHCASGKDRTGLLCALTHRLAGVRDEDILADYMATNALLTGRLPFFREAARKSGRELSDDELLAYIGAGPDKLDAAFGAMDARHGSVDGYLEAALGLDGATRSRLRERLLDPHP